MSRASRGEQFVSSIHTYVPDDLDLFILEKMVEDGTITFKELAAMASSMLSLRMSLKSLGFAFPNIDER